MAREQVVWVDADGGELNLNDWVNYICLRDKSGMASPNYTFSSTKLPLSEGAMLNGVTVQPTYVDLKQIVRSSSASGLRTLMRDLQYRLDPTRGIGQLKIVSDGDTRILNCYPEGIKKDVDKITFKEMNLGFSAIEDPYWYAATATSVTIENTSVSVSFFSSTFLPLKLVKSTIYSVETINNPGDVHCYPIWTITGPGEGIVLKNLTSNKSINFVDGFELESGQELIVDCRNLAKTVKLDGEDTFEMVDKLSSFWPFLKGNNQIQVQITNASLDTVVKLEFTPRYGSA
mgnify:CR=1 FL=1